MTATVSSHLLNGTDGTHAGGIAITLSRLSADGGRELLFASQTDTGGRLVREIDLSGADPESTYEMVFATGPYWQQRDLPRDGPQIMREIVVRFQMPDAEARYHIPVILSPNSYSCWWSS